MPSSRAAPTSRCRIPEDRDRRARAVVYERVERLVAVRALDVHDCATRGVGPLLQRLGLDRVALGALGVEAIDERGKIVAHQAAECGGVAVVLAGRQAAGADPVFELGQPQDAGTGFDEVRAPLRRQGGDVGRVAQVEERVAGHIRVVQDAVKDLQLGDRAPTARREPRLALTQLRGRGVRYPPVALAQQAYKVGPPTFDLA